MSRTEAEEMITTAGLRPGDFVRHVPLSRFLCWTAFLYSVAPVFLYAIASIADVCVGG